MTNVSIVLNCLPGARQEHSREDALLVRLLNGRQSYVENTSTAMFAFGPDLSPMLLYHRFADGEAQAGALGGFSVVAVRLKLDMSSVRKLDGYWDDFANLKNELNAFIVECGTEGIMPTISALNEARRGDLVNAIRKHGGFPAVAQRLGLERPDANRPTGYWEDFAHLEKVYCSTRFEKKRGGN